MFRISKFLFIMFGDVLRTANTPPQPLLIERSLKVAAAGSII